MWQTLLCDAKTYSLASPPHPTVLPDDHSPEAQQSPHHVGTAALSACHQYLPAVLPGCNLRSFNLHIVSLDLVIVADLFVQLLYPLCEGHVIPCQREQMLSISGRFTLTSIFKLYLEGFFFHWNPTLSVFLLLIRHFSKYIFSRYTWKVSVA